MVLTQSQQLNYLKVKFCMWYDMVQYSDMPLEAIQSKFLKVNTSFFQLLVLSYG